jgi:outer membrane receptor protein involved in Fe transport
MRMTSQAKSVLILSVSLLALSSGGALAQTATTATAQPADNAIEVVVVTANKRSESVQDVPIAVSAFGQGTLDKLNIEGGPNLLYAIPNVTFSKGNFTGSNFTIRGVGSKAVGASADSTVGVHQNGVPLTANLLFEAEFFDSERVEVLRGPQGTLYGRNATGGVINVITNKPRFEEWGGSGELTLGDYDTMKARGHINVPIGDKLALRIAATGTSRSGYGENLTTGNDIDGRSLYAYRATLAADFSERFRGWVSYDYFKEDDNRLRTSRQLCKTDNGKTSVDGVAVTNTFSQNSLGQGCTATAVDSADASGVVNTAATLGGLVGNLTGLISGNTHAGVRAPSDVRNIYSDFDPIYRAEQKLWMGQLEFDVTDNLKATYLVSYGTGSVFSNEDYNKLPAGKGFNTTSVSLGGVVTDPQLGQSSTLRTYDISSGESKSTTHELRLQSDFDGKLNFTVGGIKIDYETVSDYYVFSNSLTAYAQLQNQLAAVPAGAISGVATGPGVAIPIDPGTGGGTIESNTTDTGRNYFLSRTPYTLDAWAVFGEAYYDVTERLRATLGLRVTKDKKSQVVHSTALLASVGTLPESSTSGKPYRTDQGTAVADFDPETTGKFNLDFKPDLAFTDDTLVYATYSRGYKGGGINPPASTAAGSASQATTFDPEFINAFELGTKNTLLNGTMQANASLFFYDYEGYQVSKIVNRTSVNENIDAEVIGFEYEGLWRPTRNITFNAILGLLKTEIKSGSSIDLENRTQGQAGLTVVKASNASNCVVSSKGVGSVQALINIGVLAGNSLLGLCSGSFANQATLNAINPAIVGFTGRSALTIADVTPSEGVEVNLEGNEMPNSPGMTLSVGGEYTWDIGSSWTGLARLDYYWQAESYARTYNSISDRLPEWSNINATLRLNHDDGFSIELAVKNLTDEEVITDSYLTDDSSGLFRNVFYTEPRTIALTLAKRF